MTSIIRVQNIQYTDGDSAITIADGGGITLSDDLTVDTDTLKVDASEDTVCINTTATNFDAGADDLIVGSGSGDSGITIYTGSSVGDKGSIFFADSTTGSSAEKKGQISYEQNNEIMTFYTNDTLAMQIDLNGHVTMPKQSSFLASFGNANTNIALNSAVHQYFDTEVYDINGDYASNTFTAPVTGKYLLQVRLRVDNLPTDPAYIWFYIQTSNRVHTVDFFDPDNFDGGGVYYTVQGTIIADMDTDDTATFNIHQSGGSQVTDLDSGFFSGHLLG